MISLTIEFDSAQVFRKVFLQCRPQPGIQLGSEFPDGLDQIIRQALNRSDVTMCELELKLVDKIYYAYDG